MDFYLHLIFYGFHCATTNRSICAAEKYTADMSPYGEIRRPSFDNHGEYTYKEFELSVPFFPHQTGTAEKSLRTMLNVAGWVSTYQIKSA